MSLDALTGMTATLAFTGATALPTGAGSAWRAVGLGGGAGWIVLFIVMPLVEAPHASRSRKWLAAERGPRNRQAWNGACHPQCAAFCLLAFAGVDRDGGSPCGFTAAWAGYPSSIERMTGDGL
jgi:hypothetical protein